MGPSWLCAKGECHNWPRPVEPVGEPTWSEPWAVMMQKYWAFEQIGVKWA